MTNHAASIERKAEDSVRKWLSAEHARQRLANGRVAESVGPYLTVSRETGAGGSEIAKIVADKLGWDVLDAEIVNYMVTKYGTPRSLVEFADETQTTWMEDLFTSWIEGKGFTQATYVHRLSRFLLLAAHHGNVVIVGRGANCLLPRERGLSVRILAPIAFRIEQTILQRALSSKDAKKFVEESDRQRAGFVRDHFHHEVTDPHIYDLVINVQKFGREDAANLIVDATRQWLGHAALERSH